MKRIISLILLVLFCATLFAGCGSKKDEGEATLKWALRHYVQDDSEKVWAKANELIQEKLPETKIEFIMDSSIADKWSLWMAGDTQIDIANVGLGPALEPEILKDSFLPLDDLVDEYAPTVKKEMEQFEYQYDSARVNDVLYAIPNIQMYINDTAALCIGKSRIQYLDLEALQKEAFANPTSTDKLYQIIDDYIHALRDAGLTDTDTTSPYMLIDTIYGVVAKRGFSFVGGTGNICYRAFDKKVKLVNFYETEEFKIFMKWARKWFEEGFISPDIASGNDGLDGRGAILSAYIRDFIKAEDNVLPVNETGLEVSIQSDEQKYFGHTQVGYLNTYLVIPYTSRHPERAMRLIELLRTEEGFEILNLLAYGLEGEHYTKLSDKEIRPTDYETQGSQSSKYGIPNWMLGTHFNMYAVEYFGEEQIDLAKKYYEETAPKIHKTPLFGFTFDTKSLNNELSEIKSVAAQYENQLTTGSSKNYEAVYKECLSKLKAANLDKVIDALQKQADDYIASNK